MTGGEPIEITAYQDRFGAELAGADEDDLFTYEGRLAMHEHFFECVRKGETPCGDIRDVIHTSRLVDRLERFRRVVIGGS